MPDDYLWDKTGEPDAEIERLERLLGQFREDLPAPDVPAPARAQVTDPQYLEAKRLFDGLDYDNAIRALDQVIGGLQGRPAQDPVRRALLPSAFEMRGRAKFGLGDQDGAKSDFAALLRINPAYTISPQVSPDCSIFRSPHTA